MCKNIYFTIKLLIHDMNQHKTNFKSYDHLQIVLAIVVVHLEDISVPHIYILSIFLSIGNGYLRYNFFQLVNQIHICIQYNFSTHGSGYPMYNFDGSCVSHNCILKIKGHHT